MKNSKSGKKTTLSTPISKHEDDSSKSKAAKIKKKLIILTSLLLELQIQNGRDSREKSYRECVSIFYMRRKASNKILKADMQDALYTN